MNRTVFAACCAAILLGTPVCKEPGTPDGNRAFDDRTGNSSESKPAPEIGRVNALGGLRMRELPDVSAPVVVLLPQGAEVAVIESSGPEIQLAGKTGRWTKISFEGKTGWVFGGFLDSGSPATTTVVPKSAEGTYHETPCIENPQAFSGIHFFDGAIHHTSCTGESACKIQTVEHHDGSYQITCTDLYTPPGKWTFTQTAAGWTLTDMGTGKAYSKIRDLTR
jgi:hypothetical protein